MSFSPEYTTSEPRYLSILLKMMTVSPRDFDKIGEIGMYVLI